MLLEVVRVNRGQVAEIFDLLAIRAPQPGEAESVNFRGYVGELLGPAVHGVGSSSGSTERHASRWGKLRRSPPRSRSRKR